MAREREIFLDQPLRRGMHGNKPDFVALALDPKMHHALTALHILHAQTAQLLAAQPVIEQGSQDGAIAFALERVVRGRFEQLTRLSIASAGVLPSLPFASGRFTPSTGLPATAFFSQR